MQFIVLYTALHRFALFPIETRKTVIYKKEISLRASAGLPQGSRKGLLLDYGRIPSEARWSMVGVSPLGYPGGVYGARTIVSLHHLIA